MFNEKRSYPRTKLYALASISIGGQTVAAEVRDLSRNGVFITTAQTVEVSDRVEVIIYHALTQQPPRTMKARVARVTEFGVGLQFEKVLPDGSSASKDLV
jgi:predicted RNA-binding protein (virulence factor B family)